jgi:hypothetical protein
MAPQAFSVKKILRKFELFFAALTAGVSGAWYHVKVCLMEDKGPKWAAQ